MLSDNDPIVVYYIRFSSVTIWKKRWRTNNQEEKFRDETHANFVQFAVGATPWTPWIHLEFSFQAKLAFEL